MVKEVNEGEFPYYGNIRDASIRHQQYYGEYPDRPEKAYILRVVSISTLSWVSLGVGNTITTTGEGYFYAPGRNMAFGTFLEAVEYIQTGNTPKTPHTPITPTQKAPNQESDQESANFQEGQLNDSQETVEYNSDAGYGGESFSDAGDESDTPLDLPKRHKHNPDPESTDDEFVSPHLNVETDDDDDGAGPSNAGDESDDDDGGNDPIGIRDGTGALLPTFTFGPAPAPVGPPPAPVAPPLPPLGHYLHPVPVVPGGVPTWPIRPRTGGRRRGATRIRLGENHPQEDTMPTRTRGGIQ